MSHAPHSRNQRRRLKLEPLEERSMLTSLAVDIGDATSTNVEPIPYSSTALFKLSANHAPTWSDEANPQLDSIEEDSISHRGTTVASLTADVMDVDSNSRKGIAVVSTPSENGTWQFTLNGGKKWTDFSATPRAARLLPANAGHSRIRFLPHPNFNGSVQLVVHAWDQTQGIVGKTFDVSTHNGGTTAFSSATQTADLEIRPLNDAPIWTAGDSLQLNKINEDQVNNPGTPVWQLVKNVKDIDANSRRGIAVVSANGGSDGKWQFKLSREQWTDFTASSENARLLPANSRIRFVPNSNFHGSVQIEFHAWDQTLGTAGGMFSIPTNNLLGGTTAFSKGFHESSLEIQPLNDAPIWKTNHRPQLDTIGEDNINNRGTPVWKLVRNVEDVDEGSKKGVAVVSTPDENGKWQYTFNGGKNWIDLSVTSRNARLLPANENHSRIRFVPNLNFNGSVKLGLRVWDQTQGDSGRTIDISSRSQVGGTTAFSSRMLFSRLQINPVNDAPVWNSEQRPQLGEINEDQLNNRGTPVWKLVRNVEDVDARSRKGIAIVSTPDENGRWQYTLDGGQSWNDFSASRQNARLLPANSRLRFVPDQNFNGSVKLRVLAWDQTQGTPGGRFNIPAQEKLVGTSAFSQTEYEANLLIKPRNDAPTWKISQRPKFIDIKEDDIHNRGTPVSKLGRSTNDLDANSKSGIAVTDSNSENGKWQYKLNRGDWTDLAATTRKARLLPSNSFVRFVPNLNFNGTEKLAFHAWDQTQGTAGGTFNISADYKRGGSTAFSSDLRKGNITIRPQNDAPVWSARIPPLLDGINVNEFDNPGTRVSKLITRVSDVDANSKTGIAIIQASRENGWWQYQLNGDEWTNFTASSNLARLLPSNSRVRFVPNPGFVGTVSLEIRIWDRTQGQAGGTYSIPSLEKIGGTTAFSVGQHESPLTVG